MVIRDGIKVIILDFDGVIVESVGIKDEAFRELYYDNPDYLDDIMAYHLAHNATIRFEKFQYISEHIFHLHYTKDEEKRLSKRFSHLVFQKIVVSPFVHGAVGFLNSFCGKVPLYLVSMSPEGELLKILQQRDLLKYFARVYAANWKKPEAIADILRAEDVQPDQAIFIGDSPEDLVAAEKVGVRFIGRDSGKDFKKGNFFLAKDLLDVSSFLLQG